MSYFEIAILASSVISVIQIIGFLVVPVMLFLIWRNVRKIRKQGEFVPVYEYEVDENGYIKDR